jgi:peptidoglycan/LPS O-acetylase OafA/YrhL
VRVGGGVTPAADSAILCRSAMIEVILELIVTFFGEALLDGALHLAGESDRARRTALKMFVFAAIGALAGWASVAIFPMHFIRNPQWRIGYLVAVPFLAGWLFSVIGNSRERRGKHVSTVEEFWPAFAFALAMAGVRYFGAG